MNYFVKYTGNKMENKTFYNVRTILQCQNNSTMSEQFQSQISKSY